MTRIDIDGESYACPFAGLFRPHTAAEQSGIRDSILTHGVLNPVVSYLSPTHGRAVIDGFNRALYVVELTNSGHFIEAPAVISLGPLPDQTARQIAISLNLDRRQLTPEEQHLARQGRIKRVAAAVAAKGIRQTARDEGVSHTQILRDLELVATGTDVPKPPKKKLPLPTKAYNAASRLQKTIRKLNRSYGDRLRLVASTHGSVIVGNDWPDLQRVTLVLRDLASGGVSA